MPNPFPTELRERAVRAYVEGDQSCEAVAQQLSLNAWTLLRWVVRQRDTGTVEPLPKGGGWRSPVDLEVLHAVVKATPDATTDELTRAYNAQVEPARRVHRSSILRALHREGYVFKKNGRGRPNEIGRTSKPRGPRSASGRRR
jgi:transposase